MRVLCLLLLCATASAAPEGESRLGTLIRWYLAEKSPARQSDLVERIRELTKDDPALVAAAIRAGRHFQHDPRPQFAKGGKPPVFHLERFRIQYVAGAAGDFADLALPADYTPERAWPLVIDIGAKTLPVPPATVQVRVRLMAGTNEDALLVDERAIGTDLAGKYVLVVGDDESVAVRSPPSP